MVGIDRHDKSAPHLAFMLGQFINREGEIMHLMRPKFRALNFGWEISENCLTLYSGNREVKYIFRRLDGEDFEIQHIEENKKGDKNKLETLFFSCLSLVDRSITLSVRRNISKYQTEKLKYIKENGDEIY